MAKQPPSVQPKSPQTGKGQVTQKPGNAIGAKAGKTGVGPSNHTPATGKYD